MSRIVIRFSVLVLCLLMIFPTSSASSAGKAFVEGIHIDAIETHHQSLHISIDATKRVDGKWRQSEIHISYHYSYVDGKRDFDATVILGEDPDSLEVSKDLGWGGLDTIIQVQQQRVDCVFNPERTCGAEITENIPVEIHLSALASDPYRQEGSLFKRNVAFGGITGTLKTPNSLTTFDLGQGIASSGYTFSDQSPH